MKFSPSELKVLGAVELRARAQTRELALLTRLPEHSVNYTLRRLEERGVLGAVKPSINSYAFGRCHYGFFIRLGRAEKQIKDRFVKSCLRHESIAWCAEMGGMYHYAVSIAAKDPLSAHHAFDLLRKEIATECAVAMVIRLRVESYGRKYLSPGIERGEPLWYGGSLEEELLQETDRKILEALQAGREGSVAEVSRKTGEPISTVARRVKALEERGAITGYYREIDPISLNMQTFNVHLRNINQTKEGAEKVFKFSKKHPHVVHAIRTMGAWDFELAVEAEEIRSVSQMLDALSTHLNVPVDSEIVPVFGYLKYKPI